MTTTTEINFDNMVSDINNLSSRALLTSLEISSWAGRCIDKTVSEDIINQHAAKKEAGTFSKRIVHKDALKEISSIRNEARKFHNEITLAWSDKKARLLPSKRVDEHLSTMRTLKTRFETAVDEFVMNYNDYVNDARDFLNGMFNPDDYPSEAEIRTKFEFSFDHMPLPDENDFRCELAESVKDDIKKLMRESTQAKMNESMQKLWKRVYDVIKTMHEKLSDEKGKFKNSLLGNIEDLVGLLPDLNITNDPKLTTLTEHIQNEILRFDPDNLRKDELERKKAVEASKEVLDTIENIYM